MVIVPLVAARSHVPLEGDRFGAIGEGFVLAHLKGLHRKRLPVNHVNVLHASICTALHPSHIFTYELLMLLFFIASKDEKEMLPGVGNPPDKLALLLSEFLHFVFEQ